MATDSRIGMRAEHNGSTFTAGGAHMHQIAATLDDGRIYTGRGFGEGMIFRGKRIRAQR